MSETSLPVYRYQSAGGFVARDGQLLLVRKTEVDEVRMPKGHVEPGEELAAAALREVREETGYASLRILADLGRLVARFVHGGQRWVREEAAFLMTLNDERTVARSAEDERRFALLWVPLAEAPGLLTFPTEREFARRAVASYNWQRLS